MMQQTIPVIIGANIDIVIAGQVRIKLAHTHSQQAAVVSNDDLAAVIPGALVDVVAFIPGGRTSYTDPKVTELRLHCHAEPWSGVALPEVIVTCQAADGAILLWRREASALDAVATA
jgi:hypothetical protein